MSVRDDVQRLLDTVSDERLGDVSAYLEMLLEADAALDAWNAQYGSPAMGEYFAAAVKEADEDPRPPIPHEKVVEWIESLGTEHELPPPAA